ncbi:hypothetical protein [Prolixibacter denitrificans]|uniref:Uncharacterized protein n=1 Tax=Prolixibacter denitrificans TaxID=1541063 RepID=A0A2P8CHA9_9BACT|nr:hypothetical protein [Prolixibacter denitrificans]PSK84302.1 hypothetical protein CLV93_10287 [Prolixibacter denitrificans]GET20477.1 hypothetical protein JCM18694_07230 [Prolixibacter denitrificans]
MSEKEFTVKNPFTARLSQDEHQMFQESVIDIAPDVDPNDLNNRLLLVRMLEISTTKLRKQNEARGEIERLSNECAMLEAQKTELSEKLASLREPKPGEVRIKLSPIQTALLNETCKRLSKDLKEPVTPGKLLIDMFYRYITRQETEIFFPFVLSTREIQEIAEKVRKSNQPKHHANVG